MKNKNCFSVQEDIEIDLDEVLDIDSDIERRVFLNVSLTFERKIGKSSIMNRFQNVLRDWQAKKDATVNVFVGDLLEKVKTL